MYFLMFLGSGVFTTNVPIRVGFQPATKWFFDRHDRLEEGATKSPKTGIIIDDYWSNLIGKCNNNQCLPQLRPIANTTHPDYTNYWSQS